MRLSARHLTLVRRERPRHEPTEEIRELIDGYLEPAVAQLRRATDTGDLVAARVYSYELLALTRAIVAACPRPRRPAAEGHEEPEHAGVV